MDTDGAYILEDCIKVEDVGQFVYSTERITASSKTQVIERNNRKKHVMNRLASCTAISSIPYVMYYLSCNLEHVLHDKINLEEDLKMEYAERFSDSFYNREYEFIEFIKDDKFAVKGDLRATWDFIKIDNNSLKRYSNFHLFFG